jgi:hypothetical protein
MRLGEEQHHHCGKYHFCCIYGTGFGVAIPTVQSFSRPTAPRVTREQAHNQHVTHKSFKLVIADHWDGSGPLSLFSERYLWTCKGHIHNPQSAQAGAYACQTWTHSTAQALICRTSKHKERQGDQMRMQVQHLRQHHHCGSTQVQPRQHCNKQQQKHP